MVAFSGPQGEFPAILNRPPIRAFSELCKGQAHIVLDSSVFSIHVLTRTSAFFLLEMGLVSNWHVDRRVITKR